MRLVLYIYIVILTTHVDKNNINFDFCCHVFLHFPWQFGYVWLTCVNNDIETGFNWYDFDFIFSRNRTVSPARTKPNWTEACSPRKKSWNESQRQFIQYVHTIPLVMLLLLLPHCLKCSNFEVRRPLSAVRCPVSAAVFRSWDGAHQQSAFAKSIEELVAIPAVDTAPSLRLWPDPFPWSWSWNRGPLIYVVMYCRLVGQDTRNNGQLLRHLQHAIVWRRCWNSEKQIYIIVPIWKPLKFINYLL